MFKSLICVAVLIFMSSSLAQQSTLESTLGSTLTTEWLQEISSNTFFTDSFTTTNNLSVGFIHLQSQMQSQVQSQAESTLLNGEAKVSLANLTTDAWGYGDGAYTEDGFEISVSNPYSAINLNATSNDISLSTSFFQSLDSLTGMAFSNTLGLSGLTEFSLEASYDASLLNTTDNPFSALGSIGYRQSFDTQLQLPLINDFVTIDRISVEPNLRAWYDSDLSFGADLAISADTSISIFPNLNLGLEGGYTNGFWYNFTIDSPIKF